MMNNTDKLLRAFIEASGFDIEEVKTVGRFYKLEDLNYCGTPRIGILPEAVIETIDYKLTKKECEAIALLKDVIKEEDDAAYFLGTDRLDRIKRLINEKAKN